MFTSISYFLPALCILDTTARVVNKRKIPDEGYVVSHLMKNFPAFHIYSVSSLPYSLEPATVQSNEPGDFSLCCFV